VTSGGVGIFLKVLHRPLTAHLLQNWPLQWPPRMKMSGSAPATWALCCRMCWAGYCV